MTGFEEREETEVVEESPDMYEFVNMVSLSESQDDLAADAGRARTTGPTQDGTCERYRHTTGRYMCVIPAPQDASLGVPCTLCAQNQAYSRYVWTIATVSSALFSRGLVDLPSINLLTPHI